MAAAHLRAPPRPVVPKPAEPYHPGCTGKARMTRPQAEGAKNRQGVGAVYLCECCGHWHVAKREMGAAQRVRIRDAYQGMTERERARSKEQVP